MTMAIALVLVNFSTALTIDECNYFSRLND